MRWNGLIYNKWNISKREHDLKWFERKKVEPQRLHYQKLKFFSVGNL